MIKFLNSLFKNNKYSSSANYQYRIYYRDGSVTVRDGDLNWCQERYAEHRRRLGIKNDFIPVNLQVIKVELYQVKKRYKKIKEERE